MYVRNTDETIEYKRQDTSFYKGIVVKNDDPMRLYRIKIYIPELSNQLLDDWLLKKDSATDKVLSVKFPGKNNKEDSWKDTKVYEKLALLLPWAEPCSPIMGESGSGRYNAPNETATISDTNYYDYFNYNNTTPPSLEEGVFGPSWFYENYSTSLGDAFCNQNNNISVNNNPYGYLYRPSMNSNKGKGIFSVPSVGSQVWVFLYNNDVNTPVYFGVRHDFRSISLLNNLDQLSCFNESLDYPGIFENTPLPGKSNIENFVGDINTSNSNLA